MSGIAMLTVQPSLARDKLLRSLSRLPPFSPILNRTLASLAQEKICFTEVAELIEKDTALAGNILRMVNSALYGLEREINSVRHAIALAGIDRVRNTVLAFSVTRMWRLPAAANTWDAGAFNLHSAATASLSDLLAQRVPVDYPEGAFSAGLFHDLGKLLIAMAFPEEYEALRMGGHRDERSILEGEIRLAGVSHPDISAEVLGRWRLPAPIQEAARLHHIPASVSDGPLSLGQLVGAADRCVKALGISAPPSTPVDEPAEEILEQAGTGAHSQRILGEFRQELDVLRKFF